MFGTRRSSLQCLAFALTLHIALRAGEFFKPFDVTYDHRALIIDGKRRMLNSAGIHYRRATPEMWPDLIAKSKEGGADVIQTCTFWNGHEPVRGLVRGFPVWLRDVPGIDEMQRFVKKIVDLMREEMLFSWQGGPIIMLQAYVKWAAKMATGLGAGVPWVMCKQVDAPGDVLSTKIEWYFSTFYFFIFHLCSLTDTCNEYYCDGYKPNSYKKPILWTENWDGWYTEWGGTWPHRPAEDLAFAVAQFFECGGSFQTYYMDLHDATKLCEPALVAVDSPQYMKLGPKQEAHLYGTNVHSEGQTLTLSGNKSTFQRFLANIDEHNAIAVTFFGQGGAQTSIKTTKFSSLLSTNDEVTYISKNWLTVKEPIGAWGEDNFTVQGILEHLNVTKDCSDYLWYTTRVYVYDDEISFWDENSVEPALTIDSMRDLVRIFINGKLIGSAAGHWVRVDQPVQLKQGYNNLVLLSETIGLQIIFLRNYGAFLEKDWAGFKCPIKLTGFRNGDINLSNSLWTYQVGLKGEFMKIYTILINSPPTWHTALLQSCRGAQNKPKTSRGQELFNSRRVSHGEDTIPARFVWSHRPQMNRTYNI
ncbi:Beta-galactosidase 9, partial [Camellia lanceoleosa]